MKKVTLIGDCHSARIFEHYDPLNCPILFQAWGKGGTNAWNNDPKKMSEEKALSTGTEEPSLYYSPKNNGAISFEKIVNQDLILVWLGYVDIRQMLPGHKDAENCVKQYVKRFVEYFNESEVRFIEPLPQFIPILLKSPGLHPEYTYNERIEQNNEFIKFLKKYSNEYNLKPPISQEQIFKALELSAEEMTEDKTRVNLNHPVDALKQEYMGKIYNLFISEASK